MTDENMGKDTIDRYLRNKLSASELSNFTFQMVMNPSLREEVEATRTVLKTLQTTPTPKVTTPTTTSKIRPTTLAIVGTLLLAIAAFFFFQAGENTKQITPPTELILPTQTPENVPIAQAYTRNEFLENAIGQRDVSTGSRVNDFAVSATKKTVHFLGHFAGSISEAQVTIWNNQQEDFVEERFVFAKKIDLSENRKSNNSDFQSEVNLKIHKNLAPGLYYFVIQIDGKTSKVGRFEVE